MPEADRLVPCCKGGSRTREGERQRQWAALTASSTACDREALLDAKWSVGVPLAHARAGVADAVSAGGRCDRLQRDEGGPVAQRREMKSSVPRWCSELHATGCESRAEMLRGVGRVQSAFASGDAIGGVLRSDRARDGLSRRGRQAPEARLGRCADARRRCSRCVFAEQPLGEQGAQC